MNNKEISTAARELSRYFDLNHPGSFEAQEAKELIQLALLQDIAASLRKISEKK